VYPRQQENRRELRVPLSDAAFSVLEGMRAIAHGDDIFPGGLKDKPLSNMAMADLLKGMGRAGR
jgi:hypothetical protein